VCRKRARSGDRVDDQSLGRSCVRFPRSRADRSHVWSCACLRACRSHDESRAKSHDGSHDWSWGGDFPGSQGRRFSLVVGR